MSSSLDKFSDEIALGELIVAGLLVSYRPVILPFVTA